LRHLDQGSDQNDQDRSTANRQEEFWNPPSEWNLLLLGREDRNRSRDEVNRRHCSEYCQEEQEYQSTRLGSGSILITDEVHHHEESFQARAGESEIESEVDRHSGRIGTGFIEQE
jgi:hypothetical protein